MVWLVTKLLSSQNIQETKSINGFSTTSQTEDVTQEERYITPGKRKQHIILINLY